MSGKPKEPKMDAKKKEVFDAIRNKYGEVLFRMGISHVIEVGACNFTEESITEARVQIMMDNDAIRANGKMPFMPDKLQYDLLDCAAEIANEFTPMDILKYVKQNVYIG